MSWLAELNTLLEQLPVWKALVVLPARVRAIEERLGMAEPLADRRATCGRCCIGKLDLIESRPDPHLGPVGVMRDTLKCDNPSCGKTVCR
jgi:hypothetical protein